MSDTQEASTKAKDEKPAVDAKQHDDVYEAVFALVGGKQKTETYEDLAKVLPALKDSDPAELKELAARKALQEMLKPKVDPLRLEYEQAAAEEDVDDLSTEDGTEWLQSKGLAGGDDEELDENGIPVVKLTRASSSFILDGPGDVKVDNFTPEGEDAEGEGAPAATAPAPAAAPLGPATAAAASSSSGAGAASYVPSIIARASAAPVGASTKSSNSAGSKPVAGAVAPGPVMTLEDELKALRAARSAANQQQPGAVAGGAGGSGIGPAGAADWQVSDVAADDEDAPEIIMEPAGAPGGSRRSIQLYSPSTAAAGDAATAGSGTGGPSGGPAGGSGSAASSGAAAGAPGSTQTVEEPSCLPGECQDTRREDALWQAMHGGVDGRALLEHMGLGGGEGGEGAAGSEDESGEEEQEGAARTEPLANGHRGLANGHAETNGGAGASSSGSEEQAGPAAGASPEAAIASGSESGASHVAGTVATAAPTPTPAAPASTEVGTAGSAATEPQDQQLVLRAVAPRAGPSSGSSGGNGTTEGGPVFEEVEKFSLDPDFDYDNVVLTRREFPYTMLGAFGRAGAEAAGMRAQR